MADRIVRPVFYEGQVLGAADLSASVEHARGQSARHNRYLHLWGIADGLELTGRENKTASDEKYQVVTLSAGMAIDGTGREIVVPEPQTLSEDDFSQLQLTGGISNDALKTTWFPVFLRGGDSAAPLSPVMAGSCNGSGPVRKVEDFEITFGRPGSERDQDDESEIADGPGDRRWKILIGFIQWRRDISKFTAAGLESEGSRPRYAGVRADEVAARGGQLMLRTRTEKEARKPALVLNEDEDGTLLFGALNPLGNIEPVFKVNAKGDLKVEGKIESAVLPGTMQVQTGVVMDGMLLPLPPGIDPDDIADGKVTLFSHVTPHITMDQAPDSTPTWGVVPIDCIVNDDRRVKCLLRWFKINGAATDFVDRAGLCDYTSIVSIPAATGGAS